ncbi:glucokinase [Mariniphaga anaerophila]|uniref:Glucokinase n=1 Tax=Mariniphaga anaerophila TaxID=1484053 RepID=A0A1M4WLD5_9BACT|nr:ROK family protein [Mariniphaga anaerophila]SHE82015.1 glucokinase [Mariniphaga anaerophila]
MKERRHAIGIDLGGSYIKYALVTENGKIKFESKKPTEVEKGRDHLISALKQSILEAKLLAESEGLEITGVGIGTPGIIDNGLILGGAENLPEWESLPLAGILNKGFGFPVFVENDANLMGLGEFHYGSKTHNTDIIFITVGTGIGGAMVLNGKLYGGHRNRGAELGHIIINPDGEKCSCGGIGCWEAHASVTALIRDYKNALIERGKRVPGKVDGKYIVERYLKKEKEAQQALETHFYYLSAGLAGLINIFSPQRVVVGGGISEAGEFYIREIRKRTLKMAMKETQVFTKISRAELGNKAGMFGAAALVFDSLKKSEKVEN